MCIKDTYSNVIHLKSVKKYLEFFFIFFVAHKTDYYMVYRNL